MTTPHAARRGGFTLIELLVSMAIAIVLLGLAIAVSQSTAIDSHRTVGAADKVSEWLIVAKQRALRDKLPRGVRLVVYVNPADPADPRNNTVSECQYIEVPDPWFPENPDQRLVVQQVVDESDPHAAPTFEQKRTLTTRVFLTAVNVADFQLDPPATANAQAKVRAGDTLVVPELAGAGFTIVGITTPFGTTAAPPTFVDGRVTAVYPRSFHTQPATTANPHTGGTRYPPAMIGLNPPPNPAAIPPTNPPFGTNLYPGPVLPGMVELQLAAAPSLAPGYSKFAPWPANPPIVTMAPVNHPAYPTGSSLAGQGVQLPFVGPTGTSTPTAPPEFVGIETRVPTLVTNGFGIHRQARPLLGESPLKIGSDAVIDLNPTPTKVAGAPYNAADAYSAYTPGTTTTFAAGQVVDILFTPGGDLLPNPNGSTNPLQVLMVRDVTKKPTPTADLRDAGAFDTSGPLTLVVVGFKGGNISTKPVANPASAPNNDPFVFARDGLTGGL